MEKLANRCPQGSLKYLWRKGDTLTHVATIFGTTVSAMVQTNPDIDFMTIQENTLICIPSRALTCPDAELYEIRKGDTLYAIAKAHGIGLGELMDANPYVEPTKLAIGQYICIPKKKPQTPDDGESCVIAGDEPDSDALKASEKACTGYDTVKCGESLYDILNRYAVSYSEFAALNPRLVLNALLPGQRYVYPLKKCACSENGKYVVAKGDTVAKIAAAFGITPSELLRRNPSLRPSDFVPGVEICVAYPF